MDTVRTFRLPDEPLKLWKTYWQLDNCWQLHIRLLRRSFTGFSTQKLRFNPRYPYAIFSVQNNNGTAYLHALPFCSVTVLQWTSQPKNHQTVSSQSYNYKRNMYPSSRTGYTVILSVFLSPIEIHEDCNTPCKTATLIYALRITWSFRLTGKSNAIWKYTA